MRIKQNGMLKWVVELVVVKVKQGEEAVPQEEVEGVEHRVLKGDSLTKA